MRNASIDIVKIFEFLCATAGIPIIPYDLLTTIIVSSSVFLMAMVISFRLKNIALLSVLGGYSSRVSKA